MKLEDQVCSLDLAKRLKELGVKQESLFVWCHQADVNDYGIFSSHQSEPGWDLICSAFTVAELGEMLPLKFATSREKNGGQFEYAVVSWGMNLPIKHECKYAATEADARAKMLIYLIENKLVTI